MMHFSRSRNSPKFVRVGSAFRATLLGTLLCTPLLGIDRDLKIDQLHHTSWTRKDGVPGQILTLAQTTDGFLWIGARDGLYRFDGIHFELYQPPNERTPLDTEVSCLLAVPDGGLWIGFSNRSTTFLKDGRVSSDPAPTPYALARDADGGIWRAAAGSGLSRFTGSRWEKAGSELGFSGGAYKLHVDRAGTLWVDTHHGLAFLPKGARQFQRPASLASGWGPFAESPDGTLWIVDWAPSTAPKVRALGSGTVLRELDKQARVLSMIADRNGSVWVGTGGHGINRTQYPERANASNIQETSETADIFRQKDGLTGDTVTALLEDREGDIWAATNGGLDRFRQTPLVTVKFPADAAGFSLTAQENGEVLVSTLLGSSHLLTIQDGKATALKTLATDQIHTSYRDPNGVTWLGTAAGLIPYSTDKVDRIDLPEPDAKSTDVYPYSITTDSAGRLLALFTVRGLRRLESGKWTDLAALGIPGNCRYTLANDSAGRIWEGCSSNRVVLLEGDKVRVFSDKDGLNVGEVETIRTRKDSVWVAGSRGLQHFDGHRFVTVAPADGSVFRGVSGLVATANNGIWFSEARGLIHIEEDEARRLEKDPGYRVKYQALDVLDGLSDGLQSRYPERNMIEGTDGRLWFATALGVIGLDPKRIPTRPLPPQAAILSLIANEQKHLLPASAKISLPARTTSLQFVYTAGSLAIPERVRFRHKLDGQDKDWQEAGTRREAFYTNLGPGSYRFHVMASNGDGLWKEAGTTAGFLIQPAFFQTGWFFSLCVAAGGVFLWMLYILRIRHVTAQVQTRLGERMMERERIARELHDTLLQGFSGLVLKFQAAMKQLPQDLPARQIMESALDRADEVLLEGRTRVRDLRSESIERQDLAAALEDCGEELQHEGAPSLGLVITGTPRPLDPIVYDEVYRIGREALVNAFQHSKASTIEVEITYEPSGFRLRVRDDGCGIHQNVLDHGRPGHWGLAGIRERAQNIGGKLTIWSHAGAGTELELTIPARLVYKLIPQESRWRKWWKR